MLFPKPLAVYLFPSRDMSISLSNHPFLNDDDDDESMQYHSLMNGVRRGLLQCAFTTETPTVCFFCWLAMQTWQIKSAQEEIEREKIGSHSLLHFSFVYDGSRSEMVSVEVLCNVFFFSLMPSTTTAIHRRIGGRVASLSHRYLFWRYRSFSFAVCFRLT